MSFIRHSMAGDASAAPDPRIAPGGSAASRGRRFSVAAAGIGVCSVTAAFTLAATPALAASGVPSIRYGSANHVGVKCVQRAYDVWRGSHYVTVDGRFGPSTTRAVRYLQRGSGVHVDGIVGSGTGSVVLQILHNDVTNATIGYGLTLHKCYTHVPGHL